MKDYLSLPLWKKKHEEEIRWAKQMKPEEKFNIILKLNLMGRRLIEVNDKERKCKFEKKRLIIDKEKFKNFIKTLI